MNQMVACKVTYQQFEATRYIYDEMTGAGSSERAVIISKVTKSNVFIISFNHLVKLRFRTFITSMVYYILTDLFNPASAKRLVFNVVLSIVSPPLQVPPVRLWTVR